MKEKYFFDELESTIERLFKKYYSVNGSNSARDMLDRSMDSLTSKFENISEESRSMSQEIMNILRSFGKEKFNSPDDYMREHTKKLADLASRFNRLAMPKGYRNIRQKLVLESISLNEKQGSFIRKIYSSDQRNKKMIVFDLDDTLIHCSNNTFEGSQNIKIYGEKYFLAPRPFLNDLLEEINSYYDMIIWSCSDRNYTGEVLFNLNVLDYFSRIMQTKKPLKTDGYDFIPSKNLKKLNKNLSEILIVDDSPEKFRSNYGNGIWIKPWFGDKKDKELLKLRLYLLDIKDEKDFRNIDKKGWYAEY